MNRIVNLPMALRRSKLRHSARPPDITAHVWSRPLKPATVFYFLISLPGQPRLLPCRVRPDSARPCGASV